MKNLHPLIFCNVFIFNEVCHKWVKIREPEFPNEELDAISIYSVYKKEEEKIQRRADRENNELKREARQKTDPRGIKCVKKCSSQIHRGYPGG
mgnify:CR=1 FL=1